MKKLHNLVICKSCKFYLSGDKFNILNNFQEIIKHMDTKYHKYYLEKYTNMKKEDENLS